MKYAFRKPLDQIVDTLDYNNECKIQFWWQTVQVLLAVLSSKHVGHLLF